MCLGDSITIGSRSAIGYPEYCADELSSVTNKYWNVVNHAVAGYKTIDLCRSVSNNFAHLSQFKPEIISIMVGTNDLKSRTSLHDFKISYQQLLIKARLLVGNSNVLLILIPPLMEGVMLPYKVDMNQLAQDYNEVISHFAEEMGFSLFSFEAKNEHFYDGVHLNNEGSKEWGKQLAGEILQGRYSKKD